MQAGPGILEMEMLFEKQGRNEDISILNVGVSNSLRSYLACAVPVHCLTLPPARTFQILQALAWPLQVPTLLVFLRPLAAAWQPVSRCVRWKMPSFCA